METADQFYMGLVFGEKSKILRRMIQFQTSEEPQEGWVQDGEHMIVLDFDPAMITDLSMAREAIKDFTGQESPNPRCAVVDPDGLVVSITMADPDIDKVEGHRLILSDKNIGDRIG